MDWETEPTSDRDKVIWLEHVRTVQTARIAELEAEVERLRSLADSWCDRAQEAQVERDDARTQRDLLAEAVQYAHDNTTETPLREAMRAALAELEN